MLSPIAESPLKEQAAEQDEEGETKNVNHSRDVEHVVEEDEENLLSADALRRRIQESTRCGKPFRGTPMEMESGCEALRTPSPWLSSAPYISLGTTSMPSSAPAGHLGATHSPLPSRSASSSRTNPWRRPLDLLISTRNIVGQILSFSRGGMECPLPVLYDEDHPDPFECLCNLINMPRVPAARHHYLIYLSPPPPSSSLGPSPPSSSCPPPPGGRLYTVGPHWAGVVFTVFLVCLTSFLFISHVCVPLGPFFVLVAGVYTGLTLLTLLRTACLDPGLITRSVPPSLPRRKYCSICRLYTGPTARHCEDCGVCIEGMDHHCPWMGHCVGSGNMGAFLCFNCVWLTYVLFVLACLAAQSGVFGNATRVEN